MNIINKIKNYFEHKYILKTYKNATFDIKESNFGFDKLIDKYDFKIKFYDRVFTYSILTVACEFKNGSDIDIIKEVYNKDSEYMKSIVNCFDDQKCLEILKQKTKTSFNLLKHKELKNYNDDNSQDEFSPNYYSEYYFSYALKCVNNLIENNKKYSDYYCKSYRTLDYTKSSIELAFNYLIDCVKFDKDSPIYNNSKFVDELGGLHMAMLLTYVNAELYEIPEDKIKQVKFNSERKINFGENQLEITKLIKWRNKEQWKYFAKAFGTEDDLGKLCLERSE